MLPSAISFFRVNDYRQFDVTLVKGLERTLVIVSPKWRFFFRHDFSPDRGFIAFKQTFAVAVCIKLFLRLHINSVYVCTKNNDLINYIYFYI